jgi:hypothetical protein
LRLRATLDELVTQEPETQAPETPGPAAHPAVRYAAHFPLPGSSSSLALAVEREQELLARSQVILPVR